MRSAAMRGTGVALLLAVVLAGCGGSSSPSTPAAAPKATPPSVTTPKASPAKVLLASARTTASAGSARMAMSMQLGGSGTDAFAVTADGISDFSNGDAQLTMHFGGAIAAFMKGDIEMRSVDRVLYLKLPSGVLSSLGDGKDWISIDASKMPGGASPTSDFGLGQTDPKQFLAYLETVSDDVKAVGSEEIRGVDTTHYHATLDLGKAADRANVPPELRDSLRKLAESMGKSAPIPADVYVDSEGRARRITLSIDFGAFGRMLGGSGAAGSDAVMTMSIDLYDFGVPVSVQAPPASDVSSMPMFGMGGFGGFGTTTPTAAGTVSAMQ